MFQPQQDQLNRIEALLVELVTEKRERAVRQAEKSFANSMQYSMMEDDDRQEAQRRHARHIQDIRAGK